MNNDHYLIKTKCNIMISILINECDDRSQIFYFFILYNIYQDINLLSLIIHHIP